MECTLSDVTIIQEAQKTQYFLITSLHTEFHMHSEFSLSQSSEQSAMAY